MSWTNGTGSAVASGEAVLIGVMLCVALGAIAAGAQGEVATEEVFELPKEAALAISQGAQVYWDASEGVVTTTATDNTACGKAFVAALAAASTVFVKINA